MLRTLEDYGDVPSKAVTPSSSQTTAVVARPVIIDLTVYVFSSTIPPPTCKLDLSTWYLIDKDLYQYTTEQSA